MNSHPPSNFLRRIGRTLVRPLTHRRYYYRLYKGRITDEEWEHASHTWWGHDDRWYPAATPPRIHNRITPLVDGENFFQSLTEAIEAAERYIFISSWCMTPYFPLVRGDGAPETLAKYRLTNMLARATERGVIVRFLIWSTARYFRQPAPIEMERAVADIKDMSPNADVIVMFDHSMKLSHSVHEKAVIVDGSSAFVTGMDFTTLAGDRWDTQKHFLRSGPNWHDVGVKVEGELVADIDAHFRNRYHAVEAKTKVRKSPLPEPRLYHDPRWNHKAQLQCTLTHGIYAFEKKGNYGIQYALLQAISQAKKYIYIENQYLWSPYVNDALKDAMERNKDSGFRVVILLPARADTGKMDNDQHVEDLRKFSRSMQKTEDERGMVHVYALYASGIAAGFSAFRSVPIYLHAKVAIIDDEWFTLGSCNLNNRGLIRDLEMNVTVQDETLARNLRLDLWSEHLRVPLEEIIDKDPLVVIDTLWKTKADENKQIVKDGDKPLTSSIHSYETGRMPGTWFVERLEDILLEH